MVKELVQLRVKNQLTLPSQIARAFSLVAGSLLEVTAFPDGRIELRPARVLTAGTHDAEEQERRAEKDADEGRYTSFATSTDYVRELKARRAASKTPSVEEKLEMLQKQISDLRTEVVASRK